MKNSFTVPLSLSFPLRKHYQTLKHLSGFVLLESSDRQRGRYDILSACPYDRLILNENNGTLAFEMLKEKIHFQDSTLDLPFQGGAIGYVSYDLGASLLDILPAKTSSFTDIPSMYMGLYDWAIIVDHHTGLITLFSANTKPETAKLIQEIQELWNNPPQNKLQFSMCSEFKPLIQPEQYQQAFSDIQRFLKQGRCYQVNYTQPFEANFHGDPFAIYQKVTGNNPVPFGSYIALDNAAIVSFSPERFLCLDQNRLITSPIKGTAKSSVLTEEDEKIKKALLECPKNRAENVMIVDLLRNDLGHIANPGSVKVPKLCELQTFRGLHHLVSTIEAQAQEGLHPVDIFKECFPGGSITGAPKREAMRVIQELEPFSRGVYCGSIGYFSNHGRFDSNIAIRTIVAKQNTLHLAAGGGLVMDSVCEEEYQECFTKIGAIIRQLL